MHTPRRKHLIVMLALLVGILLSASVGMAQQPLPLPEVGGSGATKGESVYISPSVLLALKKGAGEKGAAPAVTDVIVNFNVRPKVANTVNALTPDAIQTARASILSALPAGSYTVSSSFTRIPALVLDVTAEAIEALRAHPLVYSINANKVLHTTMIEANALTGVNDAHSLLNLTGAGFRAAIIDTGIDASHPALSDSLFHQHCFRTEGDCPGGVNVAFDQDGHGTHVAGIITGANGVAPDVEFAALKVFTTGDTSDENILNALDYIIDNDATLQIDFVNMSLGGDNYKTQAECDADNAAYVTAFASLNALGITNFVSTGNDASIVDVGAPGCATGAVGVGSVTDATVVTGFSNCTDNGQPNKVTCFSNATPVQGEGELVDLLAPGCRITSEVPENDTDTYCGTSMATPYALGVAALVGEYLTNNSIAFTPESLEWMLEDSGLQLSDYRMLDAVTFPRVAPLLTVGAIDAEEPTNFEITSTTPTEISMQWTLTTDATEYHIYRSLPSGSFEQIGSVPHPTGTYTDTSPVCGILTYFVKGFDGDYESFSSNTDSGVSRPCPLAPTDLTATSLATNSVQLDWTDNATDETAYVVERSTNGAAYVTIATLGADSTTYTDSALACGRYTYRVAAVRNGDYSEYSNTVVFAACAPSNDLFENAEVIPAATGTVSDPEPNAKYATESDTDPTYWCKWGGEDYAYNGVWYKITPASDFSLAVTTASTTLVEPDWGVPDTIIAVFRDDSGTLVDRGCNDDISNSTISPNYRSNLRLNITAGETYYVFVSQWVPTDGTASGSLVTAFTFGTPLAVPANDEFANATPITFTSLPSPYINTVTGAQNTNVLREDPIHECQGEVVYPTNGTHTLWWSYTPTIDTELTLDTLSSTGSYTDTVMSVFTGTLGNFESVACNDDEPAPGASFRSKITNLPVTAGTTYYILVSRWSLNPTTSAATAVLRASIKSIVVSESTLTLAEGGAAQTYSIALSGAPAANVTVTVTGDAQCEVSGSPLTFTTANYATPKIVTVEAVDDADVEGTHSCTITHSVSSSDTFYNSLTIADVTGTITDNDEPIGVTVSPTTLTLTEGEAGESYTVVLLSAPTDDVTITPAGDAQCSVSAPVVFTSANWSTPQSITVTAIDDSDIEGEHTCTVTNTASSTDAAYNGVTVDDVSATITDNDSAGPTTQELLINGDFEIAGEKNKIPDGWKVLRATGDKRACKPGKPNNGDCAIKLVGSAGEDSVFRQDVDLTGLTLSAGDTLDLSAFVKSKVSKGSKLVLIVKYSDGTQQQKNKIGFGVHTSYEQVSVPTLTLESSAVSLIRVHIKHTTTSGNRWVDDASLILTPAVPRGAVDILPPPAAPEGFRGMN